MKWLTILLLLSPLAFAESYEKVITQEIKFTLNCKVTDQVIIKTKDGVVQKFSGYEDRVSIGESFPIEFVYTVTKPRKNYPDFTLSIQDITYAMNGVLLGGSPMDLAKGKICNRDRGGDICDHPGSKADDYLKRRFESKIIDNPWDISPDEINANSDGQTFGMRRYYKNDWELIYSDGSLEYGVHTLTANCMGMPSKFDRLIQALREQYDKKY